MKWTFMTALIREPLYLFVTVSIVLFVATFLGHRLALRTGINDDNLAHGHIESWRQGLFVLLGLLLGFTVAMALPKFDLRRSLVSEEAHAIDTVWLRAQTLPEPQRDHSLQLMRQYVVVRSDFINQKLTDQERLNRHIQHTRDLQNRLWQQMLPVVSQNQNSITAAYENALNDMIGVWEKRLTAFENRVPQEVWYIIFVVAIFQAFLTGYSSKRTIWVSFIGIPVVLAAVMSLVADLDGPHAGYIRIEQNSMTRLVNDFGER